MNTKAVQAQQILDAVFHYKVLRIQQILLMFPRNEEIVMNLLNHFDDAHRLILDNEKGIVACNEEWAIRGNPANERALWVLLDFWDKVDFHLPGTDGVTITAYTSEGEYDLIAVEPGKEAQISEFLDQRKECLSERIILVLYSAKQIPLLPAEGIRAYCVVSESGQTTYYTKSKGDAE